ncbi:MAG: OmpA family protein [Hyphomicrobiales bacterium]|nr:OmpA family protein [Hyphomicrobiales bacterium]
MTVERRRDNPPKEFSVFGERAPIALGLITALAGIVMSSAAVWILLSHSQNAQTVESLFSQRSEGPQVEFERTIPLQENRSEAPAPSVQKLNMQPAARAEVSVATASPNPLDQQLKSEHRLSRDSAQALEAVQSVSDGKGTDVAPSKADDGDRVRDRGSGRTADVNRSSEDGAAQSSEATPVLQALKEQLHVSSVAEGPNAADQTVGQAPRACAPLFSATFFSNAVSPIAENLSAKVKALALWLKDNPEATLIVEGHTDVWGPESYNLALSERRAESVVKLLVAAGAPSDDRLLAQGLGEEVALRRGGVGSDKDRRVSMRVEGGTPCQQAFATGELDR